MTNILDKLAKEPTIYFFALGVFIAGFLTVAISEAFVKGSGGLALCAYSVVFAISAAVVLTIDKRNRNSRSLKNRS